MFILYENAAGFALFKVLDESKLDNLNELQSNLQTAEGCKNMFVMSHFEKFSRTDKALKATKKLIKGKLSKKLTRLVKKFKEMSENGQLAVSDPKIGNTIHDKLNVDCITSPAIQEMMRGIRQHFTSLMPDITQKEINHLALGLAHSCSRYKLKFNPERIDTMIIQGISLLDDIDKELNNYIMRCREWYSWHFPEMGKILTDNIAYVKVVKAIGNKLNIDKCDISHIVNLDLYNELKAAAAVSSGTDITEDDMDKILTLCNQIIEISEYRESLNEYIRNRMHLVAPNLSILVGELVGARLISHAGSLMNLAKHPSSTVQVLGAEKALFNALKTRKNTPKYGLIYHASLITQAPTKYKGRMSRSLAAKCSLAIRCDALSEKEIFTQFTIKNKAKLEKQLRSMEQNTTKRISGASTFNSKYDKYSNKSEVYKYNPTNDSTLQVGTKRKLGSEAIDITKENSQIEDENVLNQSLNVSKKKLKKMKIAPEAEMS